MQNTTYPPASPQSPKKARAQQAVSFIRATGTDFTAVIRKLLPFLDAGQLAGVLHLASMLAEEKSSKCKGDC